MHKDLSDKYRAWLLEDARETVGGLFNGKQSLALAREAWLAAFDAAAEQLDSGE